MHCVMYKVCSWLRLGAGFAEKRRGDGQCVVYCGSSSKFGVRDAFIASVK